MIGVRWSGSDGFGVWCIAVRIGGLLWGVVVVDVVGWVFVCMGVMGVMGVVGL